MTTCGCMRKQLFRLYENDRASPGIRTGVLPQSLRVLLHTGADVQYLKKTLASNDTYSWKLQLPT